MNIPGVNPETGAPHSPVTEEGRQGYMISDSPADNLRLGGNGPDGDLGVEYNTTDQVKSVVDALSAEGFTLLPRGGGKNNIQTRTESSYELAFLLTTGSGRTTSPPQGRITLQVGGWTRPVLRVATIRKHLQNYLIRR
jgi:hypothetical protein